MWQNCHSAKRHEKLSQFRNKPPFYFNLMGRSMVIFGLQPFKIRVFESFLRVHAGTGLRVCQPANEMSQARDERFAKCP
jgi:hypothetical protein